MIVVPLGYPRETRTRVHGYGFRRVRVRVPLENPRVSRDTPYQPPTSLRSPLVPPCRTACGPSRRPPTTSTWPNTAINTEKHTENEDKRRNSVSSETGTPSSKNPQTVVTNDGKGFIYDPPDEAPSQIGPPPLPASISKQNGAKPRTYGQIWQPLGSPFANCCESPRLPSGNVPASNATCLDVFRHRSEPVSSISGPRHGVTVLPCPQDLPASKSTRTNAFSRVSNLPLPRTGPPRLSEPLCSSCASKITSSGDYHHPTLPGLSRTNADAPRSFKVQTWFE